MGPIVNGYRFLFIFNILAKLTLALSEGTCLLGFYIKLTDIFDSNSLSVRPNTTVLMCTKQFKISSFNSRSSSRKTIKWSDPYVSRQIKTMPEIMDFIYHSQETWRSGNTPSRQRSRRRTFSLVALFDFIYSLCLGENKLYDRSVCKRLGSIEFM